MVLQLPLFLRALLIMIYTNIIHPIRKILNLTCNEYCVLDLIYRMQNNDTHWCYASKEYMGKVLDLSKPTILSIIKNLIINDFVTMHPQTKHLRSTQKYIDLIENSKLHFDELRNLTNGKETLPKKSRNFTEIGKETLLNNNINNNIDNNINNKEEFINLIENFDNELGELKQEFIEYWTENSKSGKMRFEMEKFFDVKRRINTWIKNSKSYGNKSKPNNTSQARIDALKKWVYS